MLTLCSQMNYFSTESTTIVNIYYSNIYQTDWFELQSPKPTPQQDTFVEDFWTEWQRFYY